MSECNDTLSATPVTGLRLTPASTVYIAAPAQFNSGGPEALHQLAHALAAQGVSARMVYFLRPDSDPSASPLHPALQGYGTTHAEAPEDHEDNVLVVPEVRTDMLSGFSKLQKAIWWLSIDHYYSALRRVLPQADPGAPPPRFFDFTADRQAPIIHLAQSDYARQHLTDKGIDPVSILPLGDYLHPVFSAPVASRPPPKSDLVVYNPQKGMGFTKQLIAAAPGIRFVPIEGLERAQVARLLAEASIYVDFGPHPGRDRLPREACLAGCCILTNRTGAAGTRRDVAIPEQYKFDGTPKDIPEILALIRDILRDPGAHLPGFAPYLRDIRNDGAQFRQQVARSFPVPEKS